MSAVSSRRTLATAAVVEGVFAFMWFGWGQEGPPPWGSVVLAVGAASAVLVVLAGAWCARRVWYEPSPLAGRAARRYGIVVGTELGSAGAGAAVLGATGHTELVAAWVCLVVGVHFFFLEPVFPGIGMVGLGVAVVLVAAGALVAGISTPVLPSTITGLGAGGCLLAHAILMLTAIRRAPAPHPLPRNQDAGAAR